MNKECLTCSRLGLCNETTVEGVKTRYTCPLWNPVLPEVVEARMAGIRLFGDASIRILVNPPNKEG